MDGTLAVRETALRRVEAAAEGPERKEAAQTGSTEALDVGPAQQRIC